MKKKILSLILASAMLIFTVLTAVSCTAVSAVDLMNDLTPNEVAGKAVDDTFKSSYYDFAADIFKASARDTENANTLVSPLSIMIALAMTANGARGETLSQLEALLGGSLSIAQINEYLHSYINSLPSEEKMKLAIANSIWFRDTESLDVNEAFLQKNLDYYGASIYKSAFDRKAVSDINSWVKKHTDGLIDKIIDGEISEDTMLYLINAVSFDAEWKSKFDAADTYNGKFTQKNGESASVEFMNGTAEKYIHTEDAVGFIKEYKNGKYSFAAVLPNNNDIDAYISGLDAGDISGLLSSAESTTVGVKMPKFESEFETELGDTLKSLGAERAFIATGELDAMGVYDGGDLYVSRVIHKTVIKVDEKGTKAAAVTAVEVYAESAVMYGYNVTLDRPFVYMIIDNEAGLPIFVGTLGEIR